MLETGHRVIVRSNEDEPLIIGTVIDFENFGNSRNNDFPVVADENSEKILVCCGICITYTDFIFNWLSPMTPKQQWDSLSKLYEKLEEGPKSDNMENEQCKI